MEISIIVDYKSSPSPSSALYSIVVVWLFIDRNIIRSLYVHWNNHLLNVISLSHALTDMQGNVIVITHPWGLYLICKCDA